MMIGLRRGLGPRVAQHAIRLSSPRRYPLVQSVQLAKLSSVARAVETAEGASNGASSSFSLLDPVQATLEVVHASSGLPWWSTFVVCTLGFRMLLTPLSLLARRNMELLGSKDCVLHTARALEVYERQVQPLRKEYVERVKARDRRGLANVLGLMAKHRLSHMKLQYYIWKMCGIRPSVIFGPPLLQLGAFFTYAVAVRDMIRHSGLDLTNEGTLWFVDLAVPDSTFILPMTAIGLSYAGVQYGWRSRPPVVSSQDGKKKVPVSPLFVVGYYMQGVLIAAFPFTALLPAGVFMYWIPSATYSLVQMKALRQLRK